MSDLRNRASQMHAGGQINHPDGTTTVLPGGVAPIAAQAAVPDLDDSPTPTGGDVPVHVAWSRVMADVQWIGKSIATDARGNPTLKYAFRGIDAVRNAVGAALRRHGVMVIPIKSVPEHTQVSTTGGSKMNLCRVTVDWAVIGPKGDMLPVTGQSIGEAFDSGDKATSKATSVAERDFYVAALAIPTERPEMDPERGVQHELAAPAPPTAEEYAEEIQRERTTVARLLQIRRELGSHPGIGETVVTTLGGESVKLVDLLSATGRAKTNQPQA